MLDPLAPLLDDGIIDRILSRLKSGKEADIFLVALGEAIYAAKVYKERDQRSFKNNAGYKEGRAVRNSRTQRAMEKGSRFGRQADEQAWKSKEAEALDRLHAAGVRVPKPHLFYEGVLLMELVTDAAGQPAPRLLDAGITLPQARALYLDLRSQVQAMLLQDLIHGDLSPYNVLLGARGPTIIDFPQVVGAAHNSRAEFFFRRDLEGIHRFFAARDPELRTQGGDAQEIWRAYVRRELTSSFVPSGRPAPKTPALQTPRDRPVEGNSLRPPSRPGRPAPPPRATPDEVGSRLAQRPPGRAPFQRPAPLTSAGQPSKDRSSGDRPGERPRSPRPASAMVPRAPSNSGADVSPAARPSPQPGSGPPRPLPRRQTQPGPVISYVGRPAPRLAPESTGASSGAPTPPQPSPAAAKLPGEALPREASPNEPLPQAALAGQDSPGAAPPEGPVKRRRRRRRKRRGGPPPVGHGPAEP